MLEVVVYVQKNGILYTLYNEIRCCPLYMFFMQQFFEKCTVGSCIEYIPGTVTNNMKCCIFLTRKQD